MRVDSSAIEATEIGVVASALAARKNVQSLGVKPQRK
jgi:hypothetical protein